jgi:hypothetical protein
MGDHGLEARHPRNLVTLDVEDGRALDVIAVALLVAMQIGDAAGDQLTLTLYQGQVPMRPRTLIFGVLPRFSWLRYACHVLAAAGSPKCLALALAHLVGAPRSHTERRRPAGILPPALRL